MTDIDARDFSAAADNLELVDAIAGSALAAALDDVGAAGLEAVRMRARRHRQTGRLEASFERANAGVDFTSQVRVAGGSIMPILVGGSRAHEIRATHGQALTLAGGGTVRSFAARVHHPGTIGDPIVARAMDDVLDVADRELQAAGDRIAGELADQLTRRV